MFIVKVRLKNASDAQVVAAAIDSTGFVATVDEVPDSLTVAPGATDAVQPAPTAIRADTPHTMFEFGRKN